MTDANTPTQPTETPVKTAFWKRWLQSILNLYKPSNIKSHSWKWRIGLLVGTLIVFYTILGFYWSIEPDEFDVKAAAEARATSKQQQLVTGYVTTHTLIKIASTLLDKPGGYLSNDVTPPAIVIDDIRNWEFGVLQQVRDFTKNLRNELGRSQTLGQEDKNLATAEPKFNVDNESWMFPPAELEYREGIHLLEKYLDSIADPKNTQAQFYTRADSLREWIRIASRRLGDLSQRLSASVGEVRVNVEFTGDPAARQSTETNSIVNIRSSWLEIDDIFYETRGTCWALLHILRAIEVDFKDELTSKNAIRSLQQIIAQLEATQKTVWSPMILNGSDFGLFANHSLVMSSYVSRANAGLIELSNLLLQ